MSVGEGLFPGTLKPSADGALATARSMPSARTLPSVPDGGEDDMSTQAYARAASTATAAAALLAAAASAAELEEQERRAPPSFGPSTPSVFSKLRGEDEGRLPAAQATEVFLEVPERIIVAPESTESVPGKAAVEEAPEVSEVPEEVPEVPEEVPEVATSGTAPPET
eukprot:gnl/TRDRNA2_/TRDRNA2_166813_c0_seq1.p1 gnl/TRDRNA2_/TRDRNA2_166813_c0~~gnl/TRDRNA2_/TRDRNA2_166813_c0_seq1.p1  ORF type:complete len:167 (-),score=42.75 gnl/TRDRNA2_/TRDRNA2_166813_c0_seq1:131-631(-)